MEPMTSKQKKTKNR